MFLTILWFLVVLSVLVLAHEIGHFVAARRAGIRVQEFGLGIPPRLFRRPAQRYAVLDQPLALGRICEDEGREWRTDGTGRHLDRA